MQARVLRVQRRGLERADGLDHVVADDVDVVVDARDRLERVHQKGGCGAQKRGGLAGDHAPVGEHHSARRAACRLLFKKSGRARGREARVDARLVHQKLEALDALLVNAGAARVDGSLEVAAHDFHLRGLAHGVVIHDCEPRHVHAHIGGRLVGALSRDSFHHGLKYGEDLHVAVVVHRGLPVGLQVEGVDAVRVVQIDCRGLVGDVDGMFQRQIPDGERLVFRVSRQVAVLVLVVELREAGGHLARSRAGRGHHDERVRRFHELVFAVALVGDDARGVVGVPGNGVVQIALDAQAVEARAERHGGRLVLEVGDYDA